MKAFFALTLICMVPGLHAQSADDLIKQAESAWQQRDQPKRTEAAIELWKQALEKDPQRADLNIRLAKASGRVYRKSTSYADRKAWAERGLRYAQQALESDPKNPVALAAYAEALGQSAQANKGPGGLKKVKQAVKALNQAMEIKPDYAYAHMMVSNFYRQAPRMMSVGDLNKALEHARKAVEYDPKAVINRVTLAQALIEKHKKDDAKAELEKALTLEGSPDTQPETTSDKQKAEKLLLELK